MDWVDYDQHARTRDRNDLWGQVRRTVRGVPVSPGQIDLIVETVKRQLQLTPDDVLLDLACGNGALSSRFQQHCAASLGVDVSPFLIDVAQERFQTAQHRFVVDDAAGYAEIEPAPDRFTKVLCYGSLSYFTDRDVSRLLHALHARFPRVKLVLLGNLPDPSRVGSFSDGPLDMSEPRSDIGVWRTSTVLQHLAGPGWNLQTHTMPKCFFAAHYRFDALLTRVA